MAGGLIQISTYGSQDLFLTGSPQITFFKMIYRRHTNFATEFIYQNFIGITNFGSDITSEIEKIGDLMGKIFLEIDLPQINLKKNYSHWNMDLEKLKSNFDKSNKFYQLVNNYLSINLDIFRNVTNLLQMNNVPVSAIKNYILKSNYSSIRDQLNSYISENFNEYEYYHYMNKLNCSSIQQILGIQINGIKDDEFDTIRKREIMKNIPIIYSEIKQFYMTVYSPMIDAHNKYQSYLNNTYSENYKFAWVEEIGHAIIDIINIRIGNQIIDQHTGDFYILYSKLTTDNYQLENYNKMIGNVDKLTFYNDKIKNKYKLIIPLHFWFCRSVGLALPLIALRYHDILINLHLKNLFNVCYFENSLNLDPQTIQSQYDINIENVRLHVQYILLDTDERKRFAQNTHEYLIEIIQYNIHSDIDGQNYVAHLNFTHPTKYLIWFLQPNAYRSNPYGHNKCQWNNFGTRNNKTGYTVQDMHLKINYCDRTDNKLENIYFNYVQPYLYFKHSPTDGIYVYSFSLAPMELQPSGSLNFSRIDDFSISMSFTHEFEDLVKNSCELSSGIYLGIYASSYNILRIINGMGGLAFPNSLY